MSTLVLCPSRGRPEAAHELLRSFEETRRDKASRLVFIVDSDDREALGYPREHVYGVQGKGSMGAALRTASRDPTVLRDATSVGMVGDDCRFRTPGWDLILDGWLSESPRIAWADDGWEHPWPKEEKASHWFLSRPIVDAMGMAHPDARHWYMDDYWAQLGWATGCARYFPEVLIEHLHPMAGKAEMDRTYDRARKLLTVDKAFWSRWQRFGKAQDIRKLRSIVNRGEKLRVFADWHHPALWEALSIVFEDRFKWSLYSPIGPEWKAHGWKLHDGTPGWSADDYLVWPDAVDAGDHWELEEPEYPQRKRKLVTWGQFESSPWDIIIASVGPHQRSFSDLARAQAARFVHQVGDARRLVERIPGQTVLASANIRGADVVHHQEFDTKVFEYVPITQSQRVQSLMLRIDSTSGPYQWMAESPGVEWLAIHCEQPRTEGYLVPMSAVADATREAGWIWHDKIIGDGYGHVLFTAAAMGRPLIGHASHYKGLMGEKLWDDLRTCIDLDKHPPKEALRLWRAIVADREWHDEMSQNIRQRFDDLVDFDAEAEAIKAALS